MRFFSHIAAGALVLTMGIPFVSAQDSSSTSVPMNPPFFSVSQIPDGPLTRGQFIDAIATRLYDTDARDTCFHDLGGDLINPETVSYNLLFADVSLNQPIARSVCVMMQNGLVRGSSSMLHPEQLVRAAEVATVFSRLSTSSRDAVPHEAWYQRFMETMRSLDPQFTLQPGDMVTGAELRDMFCVLKHSTSQLDPMGEFTQC